MKKIIFIVTLTFAALVSINAADAMVFSSVRVENIMGPGAQVKWDTDVPGDSKVFYRKSTDPAGTYPYSVFGDCYGSMSVTAHCVNLTGLDSATSYFYVVKSTDSASVEFADTERSFTSGSGGGGGAPTPPSSLRQTGSAASSITLAWDDNSSNEDKFNLERTITGGGSWALVVQTGPSVTGYTDTGVTSGSYYDYRVQSCLSGYGCSAYTYVYGVTPASVDTQPPSIPATPGITTLTYNQVALSWGASTDNVGVSGYKIFRNSSLLGNIGGTSYSDMTVAPGTTYTYYIKAFDAAGNESSPSSYVTANVPSSGGSSSTTIPNAPTLNALSIMSGTFVNLPWTSVSGASWYNISRRTPAGSGSWTLLASNITTVNYTDNSSVAGTSYEYRVNACNSAGCSADSNYQSITTASATPPPPPPSSPPPSASGDTSLVGYWKFDGNGINEVAGKPNAVTVGSASFNSSGGTTGGYLYIPSSGSYARVPYDSAYDLPTAFTVEFWFRQRADRAFLQDLVYKGSPTNNYNFRVFRQLWNQYNYGPVITGYTALSTGYWTQTSNPNQLSHNAWHHVAFVKDSTRRAYYLDGAEIHSAPDSPTAKTPANDIIIGNSAVDTDIDNLRIYNRALSASEVLQNGGFSSSPPPPPPPPPPPSSSSGTLPTVDLKVNGSDASAYVTTPGSYGLSWTTTGNTTTCTPGGQWAGSGSKSAPSGSWSFTGVTITGTLTYSLTCSNSYGSASDYVTVVLSTSGSSSTSGSVPTPPSSLRQTGSTGTSITLAWNDNSSNEDKFNLDRATSGGGNWTSVIQAGSNVIGYTDTNVASGVYYDYRVQACLSGYGCSAYAYVYGVMSGTTTIPPPPPPPPPPSSSSGTLPTVDLKVNGSDASAYVTTPGSYGLSWTTTGNTTTCTPGGQWAGSGSKSAPSGSWSFTGVTITGTLTYSLTCSNSYGSASDYVTVVLAASGTATTATTTSSVPPPTPTVITPLVTGWGLNLNTDGNATIGIAFNTEMDPSTFFGSMLAVYEAANTVAGPIAASVSGSNYSAMITGRLTPGVVYASVIKAGAKAKNGAILQNQYVCIFTAPASGYLTACPSSVGQLPTTQPTTIQTATIRGTVSDGSGKRVTGAAIHIFQENGGSSFGGVTDSGGGFSISLPGGAYILEVFPPAVGDYLKSASQRISVAPGEAKDVALIVGNALQAVKILSGTVSGPSGPVANVRIGAYNSETQDWRDARTNSQGAYTLRLGSGKWFVRIVVEDGAGWYASGGSQEVIFANDNTSEEKKLDFSVSTISATISVVARDQNGNPVADAGLILDVNPRETETPIAGRPEFRKTDLSGVASFAVRPGTYYLRAFVSADRGYTNPGEQRIDVVAGVEKKASVLFVKLDQTDRASIIGKVRRDDGSPAQAFVWAWSEKGGIIDGRADATGAFALSGAALGTWHVGAGAEIDGYAYKSSEITLEVAGVTPVEIVLSRVSEKPVPPPVVVRQSATNPTVAQFEDGAKVFIPSQAAASVGSINTQIAQTSEVPRQSSERVVGAVYDVSITGDSGSEISQLQGEIEITIPYDEAELTRQGLKPEDIAPGYFDDTTGAWIRVNNYTIDKVNHSFVARVTHLTRFALIAAADTTPPEVPGNITVGKNPAGGLLVKWTNPAKDFDHVKIYRSTQKGSLGIVILNSAVPSGAYVDNTNLSAGTTYYYLVRAIDPAGNESINTEQRSAVPSTVATQAVFARNLRQGVSGADVTLLQQLLIAEGVYPEKIISGYFGPKTKAAVIRLQEKYSDEILVPVGLLKGSGFVGAGTRAKLNALILKSA